MNDRGAQPGVVDIDERNFDALVARSAIPVLVDFYAPWCAPCRSIAPHVEALAKRYAGRVVVGKCDADANPRLAEAYEVRTLPTMMAFSAGRVVGQLAGVTRPGRIEELMTKALERAGVVRGETILK